MKFCITVLLLLIASKAVATVGGPQFLTFLGVTDSSLYFVYEYNDEMANPPELWQYSLANNSLYISTSWINYPDESIEEAIVRNNFNFHTPVVDTLNHNLSIAFGEPDSAYMELMDLYYSRFPVEAEWNEIGFYLIQCFNKDEKPTISEQLQIEEYKVSFAIVRYKGVCFEVGYEKDTLIVARQLTESMTALETAEVSEKDHKPLVIAIIVLAISMMLVIFLRKD